ncbi:hypothetical protein SVA_2463 [Sulfurifustis variabilis]|uniref:PilZ domain-containing protein n=1 Tax=Sulfurifustis variabilis TaxID=1675686 RepID=A0A1B4VCB5_9GAMM|nr:PilZ domain-containing protein [Sulfurifustis variabilis]BAU49011.1 hypothetical protein SVA_2463 [Sulfurifustis variabilis]
MGMEHRWSDRRPADLPVTLAYRPLGLIRGRLQDLSGGGAYIRTRIALLPNTPVELVVPNDEQDATRLLRLPAIVTRSGPEGAGLMFTQLTATQYEALLARARAALAPRPAVADRSRTRRRSGEP